MPTALNFCDGVTAGLTGVARSLFRQSSCCCSSSSTDHSCRSKSAMDNAWSESLLVGSRCRCSTRIAATFFLSWIGFLRPKKNQYISHVPRIPLPRQTRARVPRSTTNRQSRAAHAVMHIHRRGIRCFVFSRLESLD